MRPQKSKQRQKDHEQKDRIELLKQVRTDPNA